MSGKLNKLDLVVFGSAILVSSVLIFTSFTREETRTPLATVVRVSGKVTLVRPDEGLTERLHAGYQVAAGDILQTDENSEVILVSRSDTEHVISAERRVMIGDASPVSLAGYSLPPLTSAWNPKKAQGGPSPSPPADTLSVKLHKPALIAPAANAVIDMKNKNVVDFFWKKTKAADRYYFVIGRHLKGQGDVELFQTRIGQTSFTLKDLSILDVGTFYWQVKAEKADNAGITVATGPAVKRYFKIVLSNMEKDVEIITPEVIFIP